MYNVSLPPPPPPPPPAPLHTFIPLLPILSQPLPTQRAFINSKSPRGWARRTKTIKHRQHQHHHHHHHHHYHHHHNRPTSIPLCLPPSHTRHPSPPHTACYYQFQ